jgi:hypothetical protein
MLRRAVLRLNGPSQCHFCPIERQSGGKIAEIRPLAPLASTLLGKHSPYTTPYLVEGASPRQSTIEAEAPNLGLTSFWGKLLVSQLGITPRLYGPATF